MYNRLFVCLIGFAVALFSNADDRTLFGLRGPVKRAVFSVGFSYLSYPEGVSGIREFTPDGEYVYFSNPGTDQVNVVRDGNTVTATISHWGEVKVLKWEMRKVGEREYLSKFTCDEADVTYVYSILYDKGHQFYESIKNNWKDGRDANYAEAVFKILETDKYGNWIKRKAIYNNIVSEIETCKLEYYPE